MNAEIKILIHQIKKAFNGEQDEGFTTLRPFIMSSRGNEW